MLYLAEVQKKSGFIGGGRVEFKLLACQQSEQNWTAVRGAEIVQASEDANYSAGALVMLELTGNQQIQRHSEASRQLIAILQKFSDQSKRFKTQEEEIEQWKQSLTYQSHELNRREMELETRQEQLEQAEADLEQLESQRQEVQTAQEDVKALQEEFERKNQELEGAWAHLNGEMRRLEERQSEIGLPSGLDPSQIQPIQEALNRLTGAVAPTESVREQLNFAFDLIGQQQEQVNQHWQTLEQERSSHAERHSQVEQQSQDLQNRWEQWRLAEEALFENKVELKIQEGLLSNQQMRLSSLSEQLINQGSLHQQVYDLLNPSDQIRLGKGVDVAALEAMPVEELQSLVDDLEKDLGKVSRFVSDQEEELNLQQQAIDEIKARIEQASEYDRLQLETELADEQDRYQMLNETLVGQRRNLMERESVLSQHKTVLLQRQGLPSDEASDAPVDLEPVLNQIDDWRQKTSSEIEQLEAQIQQLETDIEELKQQIERQTGEQSTAQEELKRLDQELLNQRIEVDALAAKVSLFEETFQPAQDSLNSLKQKLDEIAGLMAQFQETSDYQLQAIADMRQTVQTLIGDQSPELAAS
ncbi:MAG: pilus motility taxis protein HmpF [Leptolyngbyaceae cyanobacterium MO_188.B28]|nr:pilus motility taxis protein HmpF [Leptolyngbyaceae cyanobacterium MO_188.B28]